MINISLFPNVFLDLCLLIIYKTIDYEYNKTDT
jgi:hypothetical protein